MTAVRYVTRKNMLSRTGMDAAGYSDPRRKEILIRKGLPPDLEMQVRGHEFEHMQQGEEGPFGFSDLTSWIPTVPEITGQEAAKSAYRAVKGAGDSSTALEREMWETSRSDLAPFRQAGINALGQMQGYEMPDLEMSDFEASPDYQFRRDQGIEGVLSGASAGKFRLSGKTLKALTDYSSNLAKGEYADWYGRRMGENADQWNRWATMAGFGSGAASQAVNANQNAASAISNNLMNTGQAQASADMQGYTGAMNLLNTALGGAGMYFGARAGMKR